MSKTYKDLSILTALTLLTTFLVWLPHILALPNFWGLNFSNGFNTIYKNFDGLEYIIIAKTFYIPHLIASLPQSLPANYFASHFPGYSIVIAIFAPILGFLKSMILTSVLFTIFSVIGFYYLVKDFKLTSQPLFLSLLFLILPARWLIVHSVGSSEPMFIFFIILSLYFFLKYEENYKLKFLTMTAISGSLAQITRPPGILLFIGLLLFIHYKMFKDIKLKGIIGSITNHLKYFPLILIPLSLILVFYIFKQNLGDFFAYFHSGDNIHLTFPPFQVFNKHQFWVGDIWLEDIVYIFILGFLGTVMLFRKKLYPLAFFSLTYLLASTMIAHRDISRYLLPIAPFILISFEKVLTSKEFKIILPIIILVIYLYSQNYLLLNTAPVPNLLLFN